jgi:signal transduction histidine kinase
MRLVHNMAIKHKIIVIVMLTCLIALILVGTAFLFWEWRAQKTNIFDRISTQAKIAAWDARSSIAFDDTSDGNNVLFGLRHDTSIVYACIFRKNGEILASFLPNETNEHFRITKPQHPGLTTAGRILTIFEPIIVNESDGPAGTLCIRSDLSPMYAAINRNIRNTVAALLLAALAAYLISSWLQRIISGPILDLAKVARDVSEKKDYTTRASQKSNDEVGLLIDAFNEMLEQIQHRDNELVKAKGELELRVQERTSELTSANDHLKDEIDEREKAEHKQAELLKELQTANQELKDFAYIASHDLKAPLRAIKTLSDWISTDYADKLDQDGQEQLKLLRQRVNRMHNLIDGILQYSRVGRVREKIVEVELDKLLPEIIDTLAPPSNIKITMETSLPTIKCEETRVTQVFQNLLSNAVKYMDKPDGLIKVGCTEEGEFWKFSIADNGPGIEKKHWERIFKIFQTLAPRDEFESTGIGLTVVKKIVELYGGRIWLESEFGRGTTFFWTFPKAGAPELPPEETVTVQADQSSGENENTENSNNTQ